MASMRVFLQLMVAAIAGETGTIHSRPHDQVARRIILCSLSSLLHVAFAPAPAHSELHSSNSHAQGREVPWQGCTGYISSLRGTCSSLHPARVHTANVCAACLHPAHIHAARLHPAHLHPAYIRSAYLCAAYIRAADIRAARVHCTCVFERCGGSASLHGSCCSAVQRGQGQGHLWQEEVRGAEAQESDTATGQRRWQVLAQAPKWQRLLQFDSGLLLLTLTGQHRHTGVGSQS